MAKEFEIGKFDFDENDNRVDYVIAGRDIIDNSQLNLDLSRSDVFLLEFTMSVGTDAIRTKAIKYECVDIEIDVMIRTKSFHRSVYY